MYGDFTYFTFCLRNMASTGLSNRNHSIMSVNTPANSSRIPLVGESGEGNGMCGFLWILILMIIPSTVGCLRFGADWVGKLKRPRKSYVERKN